MNVDTGTFRAIKAELAAYKARGVEHVTTAYEIGFAAGAAIEAQRAAAVAEVGAGRHRAPRPRPPYLRRVK